MATTKFTKSPHQQATKHNNARGGFTNFTKRAGGRTQAYNGGRGLVVEPPSSSGVLGQSVWSDA